MVRTILAIAFGFAAVALPSFAVPANLVERSCCSGTVAARSPMCLRIVCDPELAARAGITGSKGSSIKGDVAGGAAGGAVNAALTQGIQGVESLFQREPEPLTVSPQLIQGLGGKTQTITRRAGSGGAKSGSSIKGDVAGGAAGGAVNAALTRGIQGVESLFQREPEPLTVNPQLIQALGGKTQTITRRAYPGVLGRREPVLA